MKRTLLALALASLSLSAQAADLGVSVTIGQPGFYGHIDIGDVPHPPVVNQHPTPGKGEPVYMRIPPGHQKHWSKHCAEYNACGKRVHFVQENWYTDVYAPQVKAREAEQAHGNGKGKEHGKGHGHGKKD